MTSAEKDQLIQEQREIVLREESYLNGTDYITAKIAEGSATREDYAETIAERQASRQRLRDANAEIARLEAIEPEDPQPETNPAE